MKDRGCKNISDIILSQAHWAKLDLSFPFWTVWIHRKYNFFHKIEKKIFAEQKGFMYAKEKLIRLFSIRIQASIIGQF